MLTVRVTSFLFLATAFAQAGDPPSFLGVGDFPGGPRLSAVEAVSADGSVACGFGTSEVGDVAFRWTRADGLQSLGDLPGGAIESVANGLSADGTVIVGHSGGPNGIEAFRWTQAGGLQPLGDLPGGLFNSSAVAANADGSVLVGYSSSASGLIEAFRWTAGGGLQPLGDLAGGNFVSAGYALSADGTRVCGLGTAGSTDSQQLAALWMLPGSPVSLGDLPGGSVSSVAFDISADGKVVVGYSSAAAGSLAFRWDDPAIGGAGMVSLGDLPGGPANSYAEGVSGDGSIIVGESDSSPILLEPFVWTATTGCTSLTALLESLGLDLTGWRLQNVLDVSDDGRTLVGRGIHPNGDEEGWIAFLGDPWTALGHGLSGVAGVPALQVHGALLEGHPLTLSLSGAKPAGSATLVVGFSAINAPFKGGTLVPDADALIFGLPLDANGALELSAAWPAGVPSGSSLWLQAWIADAAAAQGFAASNAVVGETP
jgi:probable HAF family extracellular repeat protein